MSVFRHWQLGLLPTILIMSLFSFSPQATARGGTVSHPDLASTRHIKELPPEIVRGSRALAIAMRIPARCNVFVRPLPRQRIFALSVHCSSFPRAQLWHSFPLLQQGGMPSPGLRFNG